MIDKWKRYTAKQGAKALTRFDAWFTSGRCVWQTLGVCVVIVIVEVAWPSLDPHWFWLLVLLTVYSAVTQPALAQATAVQSKELQVLIAEIKKLAETQAVELEEEGEILDDVRTILKDVHGK